MKGIILCATCSVYTFDSHFEGVFAQFIGIRSFKILFWNRLVQIQTIFTKEEINNKFF